jgi:micrococcal nuclease
VIVGVFSRPLAKLLACFCVLLLIGGVIDATVFRNGRSEPSRESSAQIVRAVDGDTINVRQGGQQARVRVLGINTPEVFGRKECGGERASRAAKRWVGENQIVTLRSDPDAPDRDTYGRLLRYVEPPKFELQPGEDLSGVQVRAGNARVAAYGQNLEKLPELRRFERQARRAGRGLWGACQ